MREQLQDLAGLAAPSGVDATDWAQLKSGLHSMLEARLKSRAGLKGVLRAPASYWAKTTLTYDPELKEFHWNLRNPGDYDQNGEVNISDLAPIAQHLWARWPLNDPGAELSIAGVVDGDGNTQVNIADLTAIGLNFGSRIDHFEIFKAVDDSDYPEWDEGPGAATLLGSVDFSTAIGEASRERLRFSCTLEAPEGHYYWVRPADSQDSSLGQASSIVKTTSPPPMVLFSLSRVGGAPPVLIEYDSYHSRPGQFDLDFYWYPLGEGAPRNIYDFRYESEGTYHPRLRAVDDNGLENSASATVVISNTPGWQKSVALDMGPGSVVLSAAGGRRYAQSMVIASVYYPATQEYGLYLSAARTNNDAVWPAPVCLSADPEFHALSTNLVGVFAVASSETSTRVFRNPDPYTQQWTAAGPPLLDTMGANTAVGRISNRPAFLYEDSTYGEMAYFTASDTLGETWETPAHTIYGADNAGSWTIAVESNYPRLAYFDGATQSIYYVDTQIHDGYWYWNAARPIAQVADCVFRDALIVLGDQCPGIVYHDLAARSIVFARAASPDSQDLWQRVIIAQTDGNPRLIPTVELHRIGVEQWAPCIAYVDATSGKLMYCAALDVAGTNWAAPTVVDTGVTSDWQPDLLPAASVDGIVYGRTGSSQVMYATSY